MGHDGAAPRGLERRGGDGVRADPQQRRGTGLPVLLALTMQLSTLVDGAQGTRRLLVTTGFEAWHGC